MCMNIAEFLYENHPLVGIHYIKLLFLSHILSLISLKSLYDNAAISLLLLLLLLF